MINANLCSSTLSLIRIQSTLDNLAALFIHCFRGMQQRTDHVCNLSYTVGPMRRKLPRFLLHQGDLAVCISQVVDMLKVNGVLWLDGRSRHSLRAI